MDAKLFMEEKVRMCQSFKSGCKGCPAMNTHCNTLTYTFNSTPNLKIIEIVEKWSKEHPRKTFLDDFKEKYPKAPLNADGIPDPCPNDLGYCEDDSFCNGHNCVQCWNRYMELSYENQS